MDEMKSYIQGYYDFWFGINNLYETWAKNKGMTSSSLFVLYIIHENEGNCTQKMICERLLLPKQTVNTILNTFEKTGLISRHVSKKDRRNKIIAFTKEGKVYAGSILEELYELEKKAILTISLNDRILISEKSSLFLKAFKEVLAEDADNEMK